MQNSYHTLVSCVLFFHLLSPLFLSPPLLPSSLSLLSFPHTNLTSSQLRYYEAIPLKTMFAKVREFELAILTAIASTVADCTPSISYLLSSQYSHPLFLLTFKSVVAYLSLSHSFSGIFPHSAVKLCSRKCVRVAGPCVVWSCLNFCLICSNPYHCPAEGNMEWECL